MLRFLFGRRGTDNSSTSTSRRAAGSPHPILARLLTEAVALRPVFTPNHAHHEAFKAALRDAPDAALMTIALDALIRLPEARLEYSVRTSDPHSTVLLAAIDRAFRVPGAIRALTPAEMVAACYAMARLFARPFEVYADWPREAGELFSATLAPERCPRAPASDRALRDLLERIGVGEPIAEVRAEVAELIVSRLGLSRDASPTLRAIDADFAKRGDLRRRMMTVAGPALGR